MRKNSVKQALAAGKTVVGSEASRIGSNDIPRLYAAAGLDFIFIDMEHSPFGLETVTDLIVTARSCDLTPIVRVPQAESPFICRILDQGAQGIIVPRVNTPQQVRDIVSWMYYPPQGIRGFACTSPQTDYHSVPTDEFIEHSRNETLCIIQIERMEALHNLEEMLSIPGVDVACLGCYDLSLDLGVPGQMQHPLMVKAIEKVIATAEKHKIVSGIISPHFEEVERWVKKGIRWASYSTESMLLKEAVDNAAKALRALTAK